MYKRLITSKCNLLDPKYLKSKKRRLPPKKRRGGLNWIQDPAKTLLLFTSRFFNPKTLYPLKNKTTLKAFNHEIPGRGPE